MPSFVRMTWGLLVVIITACRPLTNEYEAPVAVCGADVASDVPLLHVTDDRGTALAGKDITALGFDDSGLYTLAISAKGCVAYTASTQQIFIKTRDGRLGASITKEELDLSRTQDLRLISNPRDFTRDALSVQCGAIPDAADRLAYDINKGAGASLAVYRIRYRVKDPEQNKILWDSPASYVASSQSAFIPLPPSLPEKSLQVDIITENLFDTIESQAKPALVTCPLIIDRSFPEGFLNEVDSDDQNLKLGDNWKNALAVHAKGQLTFTVNSRINNQKMICLKPYESGQRQACADNEFHVVGNELRAPDNGVWSLSYYFTDSLGRRSSVSQITLVVIQKRVIDRILSDVEDLIRSATTNQLDHVIASLFSALGQYNLLILNEEKNAVVGALTGVFISVGHSLNISDYLSSRSQNIEELSFHKDGTLAVRYVNGTAAILSKDHQKIASFDNVRSLTYAPAWQGYIAHFLNGKVDIVNNQGIFVKTLRDKGAMQTLIATEARVVLIREKERILLVDGDGKESDGTSTDLAKHNFHPQNPDEEFITLSMTPDTAFILFGDRQQLALWDRGRSRLETYTVPKDASSNKSNCTIQHATLSQDGSRVFIALDKENENRPYLKVETKPLAPNGDRGCGLVEWNPKDNTKKLLTYYSLNMKGGELRTPHSVSQILLGKGAGEGKKNGPSYLIVASHLLKSLTYWRLDGATPLGAGNSNDTGTIKDIEKDDRDEEMNGDSVNDTGTIKNIEEDLPECARKSERWSLQSMKQADRFVLMADNQGCVYMLDINNDLDTASSGRIHAYFSPRFLQPRGDTVSTSAAALSPDKSTLVIGNLDLVFQRLDHNLFRTLPVSTINPVEPVIAKAEEKEGDVLYYLDQAQTIRRLALASADAEGNFFHRSKENIYSLAATNVGLAVMTAKQWYLLHSDGTVAYSQQLIATNNHPFKTLKIRAFGPYLLVMENNATSLWRASSSKDWQLVQTWQVESQQASFNADGSRLALLLRNPPGTRNLFAMQLINTSDGSSLFLEDRPTSENVISPGEFTPFDSTGRFVIVVTDERISTYEAFTGKNVRNIDASDVHTSEAWAASNFDVSKKTSFKIARFTPNSQSIIATIETAQGLRTAIFPESGPTKWLQNGMESLAVTADPHMPIISSPGQPTLSCQKQYYDYGVFDADGELLYNICSNGDTILGIPGYLIGIRGGKTPYIKIWPLLPIRDYQLSVCKSFQGFSLLRDQPWFKAACSLTLSE